MRTADPKPSASSHGAENQRAEGEERKAPQTVKIDGQDTDCVRRILDNLLVKRRADPKSSASFNGKKAKVVKGKSQLSDGPALKFQEAGWPIFLNNG
ncbi:unnamed protein product [Mytilus coruscus]|nr:unnamed protein product [Mytilus coruscus]